MSLMDPGERDRMPVWPIIFIVISTYSRYSLCHQSQRTPMSASCCHGHPTSTTELSARSVVSLASDPTVEV